MTSKTPSDAVLNEVYLKASQATKWKLASLCHKTRSLTDGIHVFELQQLGSTDKHLATRLVAQMLSFAIWLAAHPRQVHELTIDIKHDHDPLAEAALIRSIILASRNIWKFDIHVPTLETKMNAAVVLSMPALRHLVYHGTFDQSIPIYAPDLEYLQMCSFRADLSDEPAHLLELCNLESLKTLSITGAVGTLCLCRIDTLQQLETLSIVGHADMSNVVQDHAGLSKLTHLKKLKLDIRSDMFDAHVLAPLTHLEELFLSARNPGNELALNDDFEVVSAHAVCDVIGTGVAFPKLQTLGFLDASPLSIQKPIVQCLHTSVLALEDMGCTLGLSTTPLTAPLVHRVRIYDACSSDDWDADAVQTALRALRPKEIIIISAYITHAAMTMWLTLAREFSISYEED